MKTLNRSFGFEYEGQFVSGTLLRADDGKLNAHLFVNGNEYENIHAWKESVDEQNKFISAIKVFLK